EYFQQIHSLLRPSGLFLNHSIANQPSPRRGPVASWLNRTLLGNETFRRRYIFPDGELAPVSVANLAGETAGFEVRDVENLREHYALTVRHWLERLRERQDDAIRLAGPAMFRLWEMYL